MIGTNFLRSRFRLGDHVLVLRKMQAVKIELE
jgi:hypothetical protein